MATLNEEQQVLVDIVRRESERLNNIISDFLSYSREKNYKFAQHDLLLLLDDTLRLMENRPSRGSAEYRLVRNFEAREALALVDPDRLKQVLWNLCDNAFRAMPDGGSLKITLKARGSNWALSFKDSGVGVPPEQLEKIFEPFQSSFEGGTGLGLPNCSGSQRTCLCGFYPRRRRGIRSGDPTGHGPASGAYCCRKESARLYGFIGESEWLTF